ncbi:MAG: NAD(P)/FAD-dependent oxidoreductase [Gemmatimonas sp.]|nr:NAD(P)/FAD-dependent oxidoreductase [Gemmatimonas sp.]
MNVRLPRVVIVGGGFGGLNAAKALRGVRAQIVIIDKQNYHLFQPLLYQAATAALSPGEIASPIRSILRRQRNVEVALGRVDRVRKSEQEVELADGARIGYDYLVLASGAVDQYFGHDEWTDLAPGLKNIDDATEIRRRFLLAFEAAEREDDEQERRALLTTVVIGGGPTGVELAGAMAEMARHSFIRDFRRIDPTTARIILVEGVDRILPTYSPKLSARAEEALRKRGVEVRTGRLVTRIEDDAVYLDDERIETRNVVWSAGVAASSLGRDLEVPLDKMQRVFVEPDLSVPGSPEIFVIGDLANAPGKNGEPLPGLAPIAIQQGKATGQNIARLIEGSETKPFRYRDRGTMATIGRGAAVCDIRGVELHGLIAWLAWIFIHIFYLIGFRNRIAVMMDWAWAYLSWQRGARLITGPVGADLAPESVPLRETAKRERYRPEIEVVEHDPSPHQKGGEPERGANDRPEVSDL